MSRPERRSAFTEGGRLNESGPHSSSNADLLLVTRDSFTQYFPVELDSEQIALTPRAGRNMARSTSEMHSPKRVLRLELCSRTDMHVAIINIGVLC